jgi:hypothetical protein
VPGRLIPFCTAVTLNVAGGRAVKLSGRFVRAIR